MPPTTFQENNKFVCDMDRAVSPIRYNERYSRPLLYIA